MRRLSEQLAGDAGYSIVAGLLLMAVLTTSFLVKGIGRPPEFTLYLSPGNAGVYMADSKILQCAPDGTSMQDRMACHQSRKYCTSLLMQPWHSGVAPVRLPHGILL